MTRRPSLLILGGRSEIGLAIARRFAQSGYDVTLAARHVQSLDTDKSDITLRYGADVTLLEFDALNVASHPKFVRALAPLPDVAVCAVGLLGQQDEDEQDFTRAQIILRSNFEGPASILSELANAFADRGSGTLVGISSVAGERGRASNYIYGAAKAGLTAFLSGLRNRLAARGVHVVTVLPGFVATQMTAGLALPAALTTRPQTVADAVYRAVSQQSDVIYVMALWRWIMLIIKHIPERLFKRMKI